MDLEVILFLYVLMPPSVGCSPPENVSLSLDPTIRFAHGPPSYDAEGGTVPGGDSRLPLRQSKIK